METLGQVIRNYARTQPDKPAIVSLKKDPLTYSKFQQQIAAISTQLQGCGLDSRGRVGITVLDGPQAVLMIVAVACCATAVPVNDNLSAAELGQFFEAARLDAIVLGPSTPSHVGRAAHGLGISIIEACPNEGPAVQCCLRMPATVLAPKNDPEHAAQSVAVILQTSGTTGRPKLYPITHKNLLAEAQKIGAWFGLTPHDRCLSFVPLHYAHGLRETIFPALLTGGSVARPENHKQLQIVEWLTRLKPTWYSAFPVFHEEIHSQLSRAPSMKVSRSLRFVLSSGTPLRSELQQALTETLGAPVLEFYGIGEAGHMSANIPLPGKCKPGTCGVPRPGEMIIALGDEPVAPGQLGEVRVRGPTVTTGYLNNEEANREAFVDGWFRTRDLGSIDADGFLSIQGRYKDLINRGGEKVAPFEVEQVLLRHPAVTEAAVFGIAHARLGEDVAAAVVLRNGATASATEICNFMRDCLAPHKIPRRISFVNKLPKDVTGKIRRRDLAATAINNRTATSQEDDSLIHCPLTVDLIDLWRTLLRCDAIGLDDDFFGKGGDSLLAIQLRLAIERLIGRSLPENFLSNSPTVRSLVEAIVRSNGREALPLLALGPANGHPFFFFHGDLTSGGYYVRKLAGLLGGSTTIFSVAPHGQNHEPIPLSIEQMASERLPLIFARQRAGPFYLGGYCNGGAVALEVARLLKTAGQRVELLVLIDVPMVNATLRMRVARRVFAGAVHVLARDQARRDESVRLLMERLWLLYEGALQFRRYPFAQQRAKLLAKLRRYGQLPSYLRRCPHSPAHKDANATFLQREKHYFRILSQYFPAPFDVPTIYYSAEHNGKYLKRLCSNLEIVSLADNHFSCITTNMHVIARHLALKMPQAKSQSVA